MLSSRWESGGGCKTPRELVPNLLTSGPAGGDNPAQAALDPEVNEYVLLRRAFVVPLIHQDRPLVRARGRLLLVTIQMTARAVQDAFTAALQEEEFADYLLGQVDRRRNAVLLVDFYDRTMSEDSSAKAITCYGLSGIELDFDFFDLGRGVTLSKTYLHVVAHPMPHLLLRHRESIIRRRGRR
jgi:hypothetical protein